MKIFKNRIEAGKLLGQALESYILENPIVLAIPRGGVETGYYVAHELNCDLSVIVARKLGYPHQSESAFGAIAEDDSLYLSPWVQYKLTKEDIIRVKNKESKELERRIRKYRKGKPLPDLKYRTVIIVDDGIATGATLMASIESCKKHHPKKLVVASPVATKDMEEKLIQRVDDVVILQTPDDFHAVSQVYEHFESVDDEEVIRLLDQWELRHTVMSDHKPF